MNSNVTGWSIATIVKKVWRGHQRAQERPRAEALAAAAAALPEPLGADGS
jgi:hypothetical protein